MFLNGFVIYAYYCLLNRHRWRPLVASLASAGVFATVANLLLIPARGFIGASWTSIAVHALLVALLLPRSLRAMPLRLPPGFLPRWFLYAALLAGWLLAVRPLLTGSWATALALALSAPVMGAMLWAVGMRKVMK
jgi:hypothetical protein